MSNLYAKIYRHKMSLKSRSILELVSKWAFYFLQPLIVSRVMNMYLSKLIIGAGLLGLVNLTACNYERSKGAESSTSEATVLSTYSSIQTNILNEKCLRCHSSGTYNFSSYTSLMQSGVTIVNSPETSLLYTSTANHRMPRSGSPLNSQQLDAIYTWIKNGAKETE